MKRRKCVSVTPSMTCVVSVLSPADAMKPRADLVVDPVSPDKAAPAVLQKEPKERTRPTSWIAGNAGNVIKL